MAALTVRTAKALAASSVQQCNSFCRLPGTTVHLTASSSFKPSAPLSTSRSTLPLYTASPRLHQRKAQTAASSATSTAQSFYDFTVQDIDGNDLNLDNYKGKVVLVVNVASQCGFTPQYRELAQLFNKYKDQGFVILGFPCNQFGQQEPGDNQKVKQFALARGAQFPMMAKIDVNGPSAHPVYTYMKEKQGGMLFADIKWNFSKFLVDRQGNVIKRWGSVTTPLSIENDIKELL